jgi:DNA-3-methyladenine glycosylase
VVCLDEGAPHAVLLRALAPVSGVASMRSARAQGQKRPVSDRDLCRGPGRLCQALGVTGAMNGADLVSGASGGGVDVVRVTSDGTPPPASPGLSVRIGLSAQRGADLPLRFFVPGDRYVSGRLAD